VKLINAVTLFFIACLLGFFAWAQAAGVGAAGAGVAGSDAGAAAAPTSPSRLWLGIAFFMWVGIFNVMIIAQAWAFANDVYTVEQGKRLFPIVALGASLGAIAGAYATKPLIESLGVSPLLLITAGVLVLTMGLTAVVSARARARPRLALAGAGGPGAEAVSGDIHEERIGGRGGFRLVLSDRYLLAIAVLTLMFNLVNTTGEYILGERVSEIAKQRVATGALAAGDEEQWIGLFYGGFFFWVNLISAGVQALLVSRVIRWIGVRGSLLVVPLISLAGYAAMAFAPLLWLIRGVKTAENSLDYSLQNTARHALFLPTGRDAKYKAKQATDTFFWRFGDLLSAGLVFAGLTWLGFATREFALANSGLVLVWLLAAYLAGRSFKARARTD
jgi:AAA family ATP:ADP antiporter